MADLSQIGAPAPVRSCPHACLARGFRPFFLGAAVYAALVVPAWLAIWLGYLPAPPWLAPPWWHGHEMLFGFVGAAVAGFLTTAAPVWSGRPALSGRPLAALVGLWAAGRIAMLAPAVVPLPLVAAVDLAFLPVLAAVVARSVWGRSQRRNHGIVMLVSALALANVAMHAEALGLVTGWAQRALRLAVDGIVVLIVVIGGRITPTFTANALRRAGTAAQVKERAWLARLAIAGVVGVALADLVAPASAVARALACAAGLALALRMAGWQTRRSLRDPLLWSLHAGMAWVVAGLLLSGLHPSWTPGLHALTAGAMGSMILAVMARVGLGHTGRPLVLPRAAAAAFVLVHAGAAARVASALSPSGSHLLVAAGALWAGAFALFAAIYAPILTSPRVDGKPG